MEISPPCATPIVSLPCNALPNVPQSTHNIVVLAAHGLGRAGVAAPDPDRRDGRALQPDLRRHVLDSHAENGQDRRACSRVRL